MGAVRPGFNKYQSGGLQHLLASQIRTEVGELVFNNYFKFSFTRNPWDKVVSQYQYIKTRPDIRKMMGLHKWCLFNTYLKTIEKNCNIHVQSIAQHRFVCDEDGFRLIDFVGKFENLHQDFHSVADEIGLPKSRLAHENQSKKRKHYRTYYSKRQRQLVASLYDRDIEVFDYSF